MTTGFVEMIITILGCLAVFIFAMDLMSTGLQKTAGERIKKIIEMCTANYIVAVLAGFLMSVIFQSSSACIVLVVGFVNARLIRLPEALCVIFGANIGTTITAHIVAFDVGVYSWIFVFSGFVLMFFIKEKEKIKNIGEILFGGGLIFASLHIMSDTMTNMIDSQWFLENIEGGIHNGIAGILSGMGATALVQSSSAVVAVVQQLAEALADGGSVDIVNFLPLIFGCNIGTTFTGLIASIKSTSDGKRAAIFHLIFNVITSAVCLITITLFVKYGINIPTVTDNTNVSKAIANAHTIFNIIGVIILFPFVGKIAKLLQKTIDSKEDNSNEVKFLYIQKQKMQPVVANMMCLQELMRCSKMDVDLLFQAKKYFTRGNEKYIRFVQEEHKSLCILLDEIVAYISENLLYEGFSQKRRYYIQDLYILAEEIRAIAKSVLNICRLSKTQMDEYIEFAEEDEENIVVCFDIINQLMIQTFSAVEEDDINMAEKSQKIKEELDSQINFFRTENLKRVKESDQDSTSLIIFSDILDNMERIAANCKNVSDIVIKERRV